MAAVLKVQEQELFRGILIDLVARLKGEVAHMTEDPPVDVNLGANLSNVAYDTADPGTGTYDLEFTLSLIENEQETLDQIHDALSRIDQGTYGRCKDCNGPIGKMRLQALPYTQCCIRCARLRETHK